MGWLKRSLGSDANVLPDASALQSPIPADDWERLFAADVLALVSETLTHMCGESCFKYSADTVKHICRHGYYYITMLETGDAEEAHWKKRRRGKPLRNAMLIVKETDHGMQGRVLHFQEHPFECISNYAGVAAMRCNLDVQSLRRVLPHEHWVMQDDTMPHIGDRPEWVT